MKPKAASQLDGSAHNGEVQNMSANEMIAELSAMPEEKRQATLKTILAGLYPRGQKEAARTAWKIFKADPFDSRLRTHKIHRLSALMGRTVYAVAIEAACARCSTSRAARS
jgi:hypothetical protein